MRADFYSNRFLIGRGNRIHDSAVIKERLGTGACNRCRKELGLSSSCCLIWMQPLTWRGGSCAIALMLRTWFKKRCCGLFDFSIAFAEVMLAPGCCKSFAILAIPGWKSIAPRI